MNTMLHTGKPLGPLRGVPISVKEHIGMKGLRLNAEYIAWWDETAKEYAYVLQVLQRVGAVFHARTTQPQSLMHLETDSNLYGVLVNPYNRDISAGDFSGGEGALVALQRSCLGIGTDVGGKSQASVPNARFDISADISSIALGSTRQTTGFTTLNQHPSEFPRWLVIRNGRSRYHLFGRGPVKC